MTELDDPALVTAAQAGDERALNALLERHYDRIYAICRRLAGNDADANDATQEALMAVVRGLPKFDGRARFTTWSYRVATNAALDELRRRGRRPTPGLPEFETAEHAADPGVQRFEDQLADRLAIDEGLLAIPEEFRAPLVLRDQLGMDYAEISEVLEIPPGTVRSRIARGRSRLAQAMGQHHENTTNGVSDDTPRPLSTDSPAISADIGNQSDSAERQNDQP